MKRTPFLFLLAAFVLLISSCKNGNKSGLAIPKDAAFVFHINSSSLSSKLTWEDIKKTNWHKAMKEKTKEEDSLVQQLVDNPEASGIDIGKDLAFFFKKRGRGGFSMFQGSIKNASSFEAFAKKMSRAEKTEKDGDWTILKAGNNSVVGWSDSKFAVVSDMPMGDFNPMSRSRERVRFEADSLKIFLKQTMNGDESLFDDDRFANIVKDGKDMHIWFNLGSIYNDMLGMFSMMKASAFLEGNVMAASLNFDDGKIAVNAKQFYGKEMTKIMDKFKIKNIDEAMLDRIPFDNVIGVMAMNFDPNGMKEMFKTLGVDGMMNGFLGDMNLSVDEILSAFKGDFVAAVSDFRIIDTVITIPGMDSSKNYSYPTSRPDVSFIVAASVNQKSAFDKLLAIVPQTEKEIPFTYKVNNEWFTLSNRPAAVDAFLTGKTTKHDFAEKIKGHPGGFYLDLQRFSNPNFQKTAR